MFVFDYGTTDLGIVHRSFGTCNAAAVSSDVTCMSEQTAMAGGVLISYSDKRAKMGEKRTDLLRGTLDLLILKALALEPLHGVGVSRRITQITGGAFQVSFGSLFPSLHRMEEKSWVKAEWRASENNRRAKYYRLTSSGRAQLRAEERDWSQMVKIMTAAVGSA
jgi:PadR family transcriptional regulator, regulatory protein PadR